MQRSLWRVSVVVTTLLSLQGCASPPDIARTAMVPQMRFAPSSYIGPNGETLRVVCPIHGDCRVPVVVFPESFLGSKDVGEQTEPCVAVLPFTKLDVPVRNGPKRVIFEIEEAFDRSGNEYGFEKTGPGIVFSSGGQHFKDIDADPDVDPGRRNKKRYVILSTGQHQTDYSKFDVVVKRRSGTSCKGVDPMIANR